MRGDERTIAPDHAEELRENKREIEAESELYLSGVKGFKAGNDEPAEFRPEVPDHLKGALLRGLVSTIDRPSETREECIQRHEKLKSGFLLDKDAPVRWFNPETREFETI